MLAMVHYISDSRAIYALLYCSLIFGFKVCSEVVIVVQSCDSNRTTNIKKPAVFSRRAFYLFYQF